MKFCDVYEEWRDDTLFRIYPHKNNTNNKMEVKTMNKNKAPDEIKGTYMVEIIGNETIITPVSFEDAMYFYKKNPKGSETYRCHPDDKFDAGWVLNDYFEKKSKIDIDEEVIVVDRGQCYPAARDWIVFFANAQRGLGKEDLANDILLDWGGRLSDDASGAYTYRVVDSAVFEYNERVYLIEGQSNEIYNKFYLINSKGLKKVQ